MLDFGDGPHIHMQRVEQIEDMPTATWTTFGMSDDDIPAVKIGRMKLGPTDKRTGFRERGAFLYSVDNRIRNYLDFSLGRYTRRLRPFWDGERIKFSPPSPLANGSARQAPISSVRR